jgi:hypothetical protein
MQIKLFGRLSVNVVTVYLRPDATRDAVAQVLAPIEILSELPVPLLLIGDFNAKHPQFGLSKGKVKVNRSGRTLFKLVTDLDLTVLNVRDCAGVSTRGESILDLAITNKPEIFSLRIDLLPLLSDHASLTIIAKDPHADVQQLQRAPLLPPKFATAKADWEEYHNSTQRMMANLLNELDVDAKGMELQPTQRQELLDQMVMRVQQAIVEKAELAVPRVGVGGRAVTDEELKLRDMLKYVHTLKNAYRKVKRKVSQDSSRNRMTAEAVRRKQTLTKLAGRHVLAMNEYKTESKQQHEQFWSNLCASIEVKRKRIDYSKLKRTQRGSSCRLGCITTNVEADLPGSITESLNNFANYYSSLMSDGPIPDWNRSGAVNGPWPRGNEFDEHIRCVVRNCGIEEIPSALDKDITGDEIKAIAKSMRAKTAPGPDSIHTQFVTRASPLIYEVLKVIFNCSWRYGVVPSEWKRANSFALFKKGNVSDPSAYRMISITSVLARIFERLWNARVVRQLNDEGFFSPNQAGFRKQLSTLDCIYRLLREVYSHLRRGKILPVLFLDVVKAFDRVPHDHLLYKLFQQADITGKAWGWVRAFLSDRSFRMVDGRFHSDWVSTEAGVPQGGASSPLFFIIYINDLDSHSQDVILTLFADDGMAYSPQRFGMMEKTQFRLLREFAEHVSDWSAMWHLDFSFDKSHVVAFNPRRDYSHPAKPVEINGHPLPFADSYKYLGVIFQSNGKWKSQFESIAAKCRLTANILGRINNRNRPPGPLITISLVKSILIPQMSYGLPFWRFNKGQEHALNQILAAPLRRAFGLHRSASARRTLWEAGIPTISNIKAQITVQAVARARASALNRNELPAILQRDVESDEEKKLSTPFYCRSLADEVNHVRLCYDQLSDAGFPTRPVDKSLLKSVLRSSVIREWTIHANDKAKRCKGSPDLPLYVLVDHKPVVDIRARLRLGSALTPSRLFMYGLGSPLCQHAPCVNMQGSIRHLFLDCPKFAVARQDCQEKLKTTLYFPVKLTIELVLGHPPTPPSGFATDSDFMKSTHIKCLLITGEFILAVNRLHFL